MEPEEEMKKRKEGCIEELKDCSLFKENSHSNIGSDVDSDDGEQILGSVDEVYEKIKGNMRFTWYFAAAVGMVYAFSPMYIIPIMKQIPAME